MTRPYLPKARVGDKFGETEGGPILESPEVRGNRDLAVVGLGLFVITAAV